MPGRPEDDEEAGAPRGDSQRVDRWLWFSRAVKSRTLAASMVTEGRVRINSVKAQKPSQTVRAGDVLTFTIGPRIRILKVLGLGTRRGPATEAQTLYEDLTPPPPPREDVPPTAGGEREPGSGRPTKRDRRLMDRLRGDE